MPAIDTRGPSRTAALTILTGLSLPILFFGLGQYSVVNADEAFYHDIAWTMLESGDWFRLRTGLGEHFYDTFANAPLQYWVRGLVISWLGPGVFGMRIVSAVMGWLTVLATYAFVSRLADRRAGLLAGLLLLGTFQFVYLHSARTGELETGVTLLLVGIAAAFHRSITSTQPSFWLHHGLVGLLVLWKTPVVPIVVLAEISVFALVVDARRSLGRWVVAGLLVAPLALAWHVAQAWRLAPVLPELWSAVAGQAAGGLPAPAAGFGGHVRYYAARLYFGAWPWITLLPAACLALSLVDWPRRTDRVRSGATVLCAFGAAVLFFYCSIAKVGPWYVVHAYPFMVAVLGWVSVEIHDRARLPMALWLLLGGGFVAIPLWSPPLGYDPFAESAIRIGMPVLGRPGAGLLLVVLGAVLGLGLAFAASRLGSRRFVAIGVTVVLALALVRVTLPLRFTARLSPEAALRADLDARLRAAAAVPLPIDVPPAHPWIVYYYFSHDFVLEPAPPRAGDPPAPRQRFRLVGRRRDGSA